MSMLSAQCDELRAMAESVGLEVPQAATLMMEAADTILELRDDLQRANAENARLLDELESVGTAAYMYGRSDLKAENTKLRLLVEAMGVYERMDTDADPLRALEIRDAIKQLAGELGIKVDG